MKKRYFIIPVAILIICLTATYFLKERIAVKVIRASLKKTFPVSKSDIKNIKIHLLSGIELEGLSIKSPLQGYSMYLDNIRISFTPVSLMKAQINKVELSAINVAINKGIKVNLGKSFLKIKEIKADGALKFQDYKVKDFSLMLFGGKIPNQFKGNFHAANIIIQKINLSNLDMVLELSADALNIPEFKVSAFQGQIIGSCAADVSGSGFNFSADIKGTAIDLAELDEDFNLKEKFEVTGLCDFYLKAKGNQKGLSQLSGDLTAHDGGGKFIITDKETLKRLNVSHDMSMEAALEGIKNYRYDTGNAKISIEDDDIIVRMFMDGELGKRDLTIVLHEGLKLTQGLLQ